MNIRLALSFVFTLLSVIAGAQSSFSRLSVEDGLPQSQVWCLAEDDFGYLWCGTQGGGLSRYDGKKFKKYDQSKGLKSNFVQCLLATPDHKVWIGSSEGLQYLNGENIQSIPELSRQVNTLILFEKQLWIGTHKGLYQISPDGSKAIKQKIHLIVDGLKIWSLLVHQGKLWIGTEKGLWTYDSKHGAVKYPDKWSNAAILALTADRLGRVWMSIGGVGVDVLDTGSSTSLMEFRQPGMEWVNSICTDQGGTIWLASTGRGIFLVNESGSKISNLTEKEGLPHPHVRQIISDKNGQIWIATSGAGIARYLSREFRHFGAPQGLEGARIYALCEDASGKIWFSASQQGLFIYDSTGVHAFSRDSGELHDVKIKSLAFDRQGRLWVGTDGRGLWLMDSSGVWRVAGLRGDRIQSVLLAPNGNVWVASADQGIARLSVDNGIGIQHFGAAEGLKETVQTMICDDKARIWFGTQSGAVGCIQNGRIEALLRDGLDGTPIRCMAADASGRIWVGTRGKGVFFSKTTDGVAIFEKLAEPLHSQNIYSLGFDALGQLWVGSENGVDCLLLNSSDPQDFDLKHFGKAEGFLGIENCQDALLFDKQGRAWFGTINGLEQYIPSEQSSAFSPPKLHFSRIKLFYTDLQQTIYSKWFSNSDIASGWHLPYNQNSLTFEFEGVDLLQADNIRYRWRLDGGQQNGWSELLDYPAINLANLAPGDYVFKVQATSDEGVTFSDALTAPFSIDKPFWDLWPFRIAMMAGLAALIFWFVRRWAKRLKAKEMAHRRQLEMQNHLLQLEQKALQLQMNPHFIFNALNGIQSLIFAQQGDAARQQIGHFAQLMRSILNNSRKSLISLQDEVETLRQYLRIEQHNQTKPFDFEIKLPEDCDTEEIALPPMLLQPFVENAVLHGVSHRTEKGKIDLVFSLEEDLLTCCIRDNGIGREKAAQLRKERQPGHQSVSVEVNRERLEALRDGRNYKALEYVDLVDLEGRAQGTALFVRIRVERSL